MTKGKMVKVGNSDERMFGPQKILVCGFAPEDHPAIIEMVKSAGLTHLPVAFVTTELRTKTVGELVELPENTGYKGASEIPPAIILSGLTEKELQIILKNYRSLNLQPPLWATLTETSVTWTLKELLIELAAERMEFLKRQQQS